MEFDSMHSLIERSLPSAIHSSRDYVTAMETCSKNSNPYVVHSLKHRSILSSRRDLQILFTHPFVCA